MRPASRRDGWRCPMAALKFRAMDHDSTDDPKAPAPRKPRRGAEPAGNADLPPQDTSAADLDPAMATADEDDEVLLPEVSEANESVADGPLAAGHSAIEHAV